MGEPIENTPVAPTGLRLGPPVLFVHDAESSSRFARDVLGLEIRHLDEDGAVLGVGEDIVLLVTVAAGERLFAGLIPSSGNPAHPPVVLNLFVSDVDAALDHARRHGAVVLSEPTNQPWGRRTAHVLDLDGYAWEFSRSLEP